VAFAAAVAPSAARATTVSLPWPPDVLPRTPPLSPASSGVLPLQPRFVRRVSNKERVLVGLDADGTPNSVTVVQTSRLNRLGDYVFAIPAPVVSVLPGPGTESPPGQRTNQILWQGFSPGRRLLSARAELRLEDSAPYLPVKVRLERTGGRTTVIIENQTAVEVSSYEGDVEPTSLAQVLARIRTAIDRNLFAEGLNVELRGPKQAVQVQVAAPLRVAGTVDGKRFSALLDGLKKPAIRVTVAEDEPKVAFTVRTVPVPDHVTAGQAPAERLAGTIRLELTYARTRQFDQFLSSPDPTGHSSTTYLYKTAAAPVAATPVERSGSEGHAMGWIALGLLLAAGLPLAAVLWARS
jgi:hypothetical protein